MPPVSFLSLKKSTQKGPGVTEALGHIAALKGQWIFWETDLRDHQNVIYLVSKSSPAKCVLESTLDSFKDFFFYIKMHIQTFIFKYKFNEHRQCWYMTLITRLIRILVKNHSVLCFPKNCAFRILISDSFEKLFHFSLETVDLQLPDWEE